MISYGREETRTATQRRGRREEGREKGETSLSSSFPSSPALLSRASSLDHEDDWGRVRCRSGELYPPWAVRQTALSHDLFLSSIDCVFFCLFSSFPFHSFLLFTFYNVVTAVEWNLCWYPACLGPGVTFVVWEGLVVFVISFACACSLSFIGLSCRSSCTFPKYLRTKPIKQASMTC